MSVGGEGGLTAPPPRGFQVLGISDSATVKEIKKTYRKLSLIHHPDKGGDAEKFRELSNAYRALTDPVAKKNYDEYGHPDGRQGFTMGIALPEWMMSSEYQGVMFLGYGVILAGFPLLLIFGGGLKGGEKPGTDLQEAQKALLLHFAGASADGQPVSKEGGPKGLRPEITFEGLLALLAGAPMFGDPVDGQEDPGSEELAASADRPDQIAELVALQTLYVGADSQAPTSGVLISHWPSCYFAHPHSPNPFVECTHCRGTWRHALLFSRLCQSGGGCAQTDRRRLCRCCPSSKGCRPTTAGISCCWHAEPMPINAAAPHPAPLLVSVFDWQRVSPLLMRPGNG